MFEDCTRCGSSDAVEYTGGKFLCYECRQEDAALAQMASDYDWGFHDGAAQLPSRLDDIVYAEEYFRGYNEGTLAYNTHAVAYC